MIRNILLLGDKNLYEKSIPVTKNEDVSEIIKDLHDTLIDFRNRHHAGRAIAAVQIGVPKRILYMCIDKPTVFINPVLEFPDDERMEVLDDCMSFPGLYVNVRRHKRCLIKFYDENWEYHEMLLEDGLSELLQHEYDHLDGILATMRAIDNQSFSMSGRQ